MTTVFGIIEADIDDCDEAQIDNWQFSPARFLKDFGLWQKDEEVVSLSFDFYEGRVTEYDRNGEVVKQCEIDLIAVKSNDFNSVEKLI